MMHRMLASTVFCKVCNDECGLRVTSLQKRPLEMSSRPMRCKILEGEGYDVRQKEVDNECR